MKKSILLLLPTSECFDWLLRYFQCQYSLTVRRYNWLFYHHFDKHNFIETLTLKTISEALKASMKCTLKKNFLKTLKPTSHWYREKSVNLHKKSTGWFIFYNNIAWKWVKVFLIMKYMDFQKVLNILKIENSFKLIDQMCSPTIWEIGFADIR